MKYPLFVRFFIMIATMSTMGLGVVTEGVGQSLSSARAGALGDQYFKAQQYYRATQYYLVAVEQDSTDYLRTFRLAESYRQQFAYQQALSWYSKVYEEAKEEFPEAAYFQALMLKNLGRCEEAIPLFTNLQQQSAGFSEKMKKNMDKALQGCYDMQLSRTQYPTVSLQKLDSPVNSAFHDYAPLILQNDSMLAITSTRFSDKQRVSYRFGENNANFFEFQEDENVWEPFSFLSKNINTKASEGAGCYVPARNEFYFTFCPDNEPCEIHVVRYNNRKWTEPEPLPGTINQKNTNAKHPALSSTGDSLFFVSDRPGGFGGTDLWMSLRSGEDDWSPPLCLDSLINTPYDEVTPFYDSREDQLIFASNGHEGFGGMDLFLITEYANPARKQRNHLSEPFNSYADDGYLVLGDQQGYLASHREEGFDIYGFQKKTTQHWQEYLLGLVPLTTMEKNQNLIVYPDQIITADVTLPGEMKDWIRVQSARQKRLESGSTRFILNSDVNDIRFQQYQQQKRQSPPENTSVAIQSGIHERADNELVIAGFSTDTLPNAQPGVITGALLYGESSVPMTKRTIQLRDGNGDLVKITTTNALGSFKLVNVPPNADYTLVLTDEIDADSLQVSDLQLRHPESSNLISQSFEPIFYDFNKDGLRPEARKVLEALADYYQHHPSLSIEINAFTDSLGNDQYNLMLSQKRGETAFEYLIAQGVDRSALAINAQGVSTAYTSTNAYVSQQLNRRVDFDIFGLEIPIASEIVTRIIRPNVAPNQFVQRTGMTAEDFQELNGMPIEQLQPYKPLRVYKSAIDASGEALFYKIIDIN
ncbi:MAG: OmpA family protein [Cyclobacteriaceae bacterium]